MQQTIENFNFQFNEANRGDFTCHKNGDLISNAMNAAKMRQFLLSLKQKNQFIVIHVSQKEFKINKHHPN
jgi:hypothetical protein